MTSCTLGATHAYIGINAAGEARAICCDDPGYERDTAKIVSDWIKSGRTVERLPIEQAKARFMLDHKRRTDGEKVEDK